MTTKPRYIDWRTKNGNSLEAITADAMRHYQHRYELGVGVLLVSDPKSAIKQIEKQWRKLTRQHQQKRQTKANAEDILTTTRTISRMQRVTFTTESPATNPDASFYVLPETAEVLPVRCSTIYTAHAITDNQIAILPSETLVVAYGKKKAIPELLPKSELESIWRDSQTALLQWLSAHHIRLNDIQNDMEHANAALDNILSSSRIQNEFLHLTAQYTSAVSHAKPYTEQPADAAIYHAITHLEKQVKALTTGFLSDHIIDSASDDSFLLRDNAGKPLYAFESLTAFIKMQYQKGHVHLAKALEHASGVVQ